MRKWEQSNQQRHHLNKVNNAKSTFTTTTFRSTSASKSSNKIKRDLSTSKSSISLSPIYSILHTFKLEEYSEQFMNLGLGYDFMKLKYVKGAAKERLLEKIEVRGQDRQKMSLLLDYLSNMVAKLSELDQKTQYKEAYAPKPPKSAKNRPPIKSKAHIKSSQTLKQTESCKPKRRSTMRAVDDSVILHKQTHGRSHILKRLSIKGNSKLVLEDVHLDIGKIRDMYLSFDSGTITSNITNIDMEEIANCLALEVLPLVKFEEVADQEQMSLELQNSGDFADEQIVQGPMMVEGTAHVVPQDTRFAPLLDVVDQANEELFQSIIDNNRELIQSIMKSSFLKQTNSNSPSIHNDSAEQRNKSNIALVHSSCQSSTIMSVFVGSNVINRNRLKEFEDRSLCQILRQMPTQHVIGQYIKNVMVALRMEKEAPILANVYLKRLIKSVNVSDVNQLAWRNILLVCLLLASKVWDDLSLQNDSIGKVLTTHSVLQLNRLQKVFVRTVDYKLSISPVQYSEGYFNLRRHSRSCAHSKGLKQLTLEQIRSFQKGTNRLELKLRNKYRETLNKSF